MISNPRQATPQIAAIGQNSGAAAASSSGRSGPELGFSGFGCKPMPALASRPGSALTRCSRFLRDACGRAGEGAALRDGSLDLTALTLPLRRRSERSVLTLL